MSLVRMSFFDLHLRAPDVSDGHVSLQHCGTGAVDCQLTDHAAYHCTPHCHAREGTGIKAATPHTKKIPNSTLGKSCCNQA